VVDAPPWAINELCSPHTRFEQDIVDYPAAGAKGIGVYEPKLTPDVADESRVAAMRRAGLRAVMCVPRVGSLLPDGFWPEPIDPGARVEALAASIRRFARFDPVCVMVLPGNPTSRGADVDHADVVAGLRAAAEVAAEDGVRLGLEPLRALSGAIVQTIPDAVAILDEVGAANVGLVLDTWHQWDAPDLLGQIRRHVARIMGVQVTDWREPTRGWADRVLPGDGVAPLGDIFRTLREAGYRGWYELEIFSDDGTYGTDYPDSLYRLPHAELLERGTRGFRDAWSGGR
jgi:sugar phosphate isomerase/epimerase